MPIEDIIPAPAETDDNELERLESELADKASSPAKYELLTYPADYTLEVLHSKWKAAEISIPVFQRRYVWNASQASRLIESYLLGLPVPGVFFYVERGSETLLVVDGQQRLRSIFYYFDEVLGEEVSGKKTVFRLRLENSEFNGKTFSELEEDDCRRLKNSVLRAYIMRQVDPNDDTSIYHVFERLNTGGTLLTSQEVRNCVYDGEFNKLLHSLNVHETWRLIYGKPNPDRRLRDVELVLRCLALSRSSESYEKPMKEFLSRFMRVHRAGELNEEFKKIFRETCDCIYTKLGERPFHVRAGLNVAVLDSVFTAFSRNLTGVPPNVRERYQQLLKDNDFLKQTTSATTDVDNVKNRITTATKILSQ